MASRKKAFFTVVSDIGTVRLDTLDLKRNQVMEAVLKDRKGWVLTQATQRGGDSALEAAHNRAQGAWEFFLRKEDAMEMIGHNAELLRFDLRCECRNFMPDFDDMAAFGGEMNSIILAKAKEAAARGSDKRDHVKTST